MYSINYVSLGKSAVGMTLNIGEAGAGFGNGELREAPWTWWMYIFRKDAVVGTRVNIGVDGVGFGNRWLRGAS